MIDFKDESSGILTSHSGYVFYDVPTKMQSWEKIKIYDNYLNKVKILNENFVYAFNKEAVLIYKSTLVKIGNQSFIMILQI